MKIKHIFQRVVGFCCRCQHFYEYLWSGWHIHGARWPFPLLNHGGRGLPCIFPHDPLEKSTKGRGSKQTTSTKTEVFEGTDPLLVHMCVKMSLYLRFWCGGKLYQKPQGHLTAKWYSDHQEITTKMQLCFLGYLSYSLPKILFLRIS